MNFGSAAIAWASFDPLALTGRHRAEGAEPLLTEPDEVERVAGATAGFVTGQALHLGEVADEVVGPQVVG